MGIAPYLFVPTKFVLHSILEAIKNMKKLHFTCVSVMTMLNFTQLDLIMVARLGFTVVHGLKNLPEIE